MNIHDSRCRRKRTAGSCGRIAYPVWFTAHVEDLVPAQRTERRLRQEGGVHTAAVPITADRQLESTLRNARSFRSIFSVTGSIGAPFFPPTQRLLGRAVPGVKATQRLRR